MAEPCVNRLLQKAEKEFGIYRVMEIKQLESDFDKAVKLLTEAQVKDADGGADE
ncbi:MAG: hypothetical protein FWH51_04260 [Dehalococcoidia bacterium]|nr:hypothetical protein [Dehalococcoidia bacterium]